MKSKKIRTIKRRKRQSFPLSRDYKSLLFPVRRVLFAADTLNSVAAVATPVFASSGQQYYNFSSISALIDFTTMSDSYQVIKVNSITIKVCRMLPENSFLTTYATGLHMMHVAYYPTRINYAPGLTVPVFNENNLRIVPTTTTEYTKRYPTPAIQTTITTGGVDYTIHLNDYMPTAVIAAIPGCLSLGWTNAAAALVSIPLYSIEFHYDCIFACPT